MKWREGLGVAHLALHLTCIKSFSSKKCRQYGKPYCFCCCCLFHFLCSLICFIIAVLLQCHADSWSVSFLEHCSCAHAVSVAFLLLLLQNQPVSSIFQSLQTLSKSLVVSFDSSFFLHVTILSKWLVLILCKFSIISFLFSCFTDSLEECVGKIRRKRKPFIFWKEVVISSSSDVEHEFFDLFLYLEPLSLRRYGDSFWGIIVVFYDHSCILFHYN